MRQMLELKERTRGLQIHLTPTYLPQMFHFDCLSGRAVDLGEKDTLAAKEASSNSGFRRGGAAVA